MKITDKFGIPKMMTTCTETFGFSRKVAAAALIFVAAFILTLVIEFIRFAPPRGIVITSGPEGSIFNSNAVKYAAILARHGVTLKILPSQGSAENLARLGDPAGRVDIGFVQGGVTNAANTAELVSLGSVFYQPILVFYRGTGTVELLSGLAGKRLTIGSAGSGTRELSLKLLAANGIEPGGNTELLEMEGDAAAMALMAGMVDAVFLMGDSASAQVIRKLVRTDGIQMYDFTQADAYTRRIVYLDKLRLPKGCLDFGKNLPAHDIQLIGPTVELIAKPDLHPALTYLLLDAAREVHGNATLFHARGAFPALLEREFPISADARRYFTTGKSFFYRFLPFGLASLVNRMLVVFVPMLVLLIPGLRLIPALYKWRITLGIYRWYRALLALEREIFRQDAHHKKDEFLRRLNQIEETVNKMKVPASFADQFYALRGHIAFVRGRLQNNNL